MEHIEERAEATILRVGTSGVNALDLELLTTLRAGCARAAERGLPVVLTGNGTVFSAGVDLKRVSEGGAQYSAEFLPALRRTFGQLLGLQVPVVAAVEGHAIAGGLLLALCCDRRLGAEGPHRLGAPELGVGVPYPVLAFELLRHAVAPCHLDALTFGAALVEPARALEIGLLDELHPAEGLLERALEAAGRLGALPRPTFQLHKRLLRAPLYAKVAAEADLDAEITAAWAGEEVLGAIGDYVERTFKKS